ncbi:MAG: hypothetical protein ACR2HH_02590 [Chthoniobacterales bacterium]
MKTASPHEEPRFYFALPRLLASQFGRSAKRTERNWLEATLVGTLEHFLWFAFAFDLLPAGLTTAWKIALLLPLAIVIWICWLLALYLNLVVIRGLRRFRFFQELSNVRIQSVLLGSMTTIFAFHLVIRDSFFSLGGLLWIAAVALNLLAAAVFVVRAALALEE